MMTEMETKLDAHSSSIRTEMQGVRASIDHMSSHFDEFRATLEVLKKEQLTLKRENNELRDALTTARKDIIELKQYTRLHNLEIKGLPLNPDEQLCEAVQKISEKLKVPVSPTDVDVIHRVPCKDKTKPNVVVKFVTRSVRDSLLQAAKKQLLTVADFGYEGNGTVYINEHLCPENKILLGKAIARKREKNWKFVWVASGKILARKAENSKAVRIFCDNDLDLIC